MSLHEVTTGYQETIHGLSTWSRADQSRTVKIKRVEARNGIVAETAEHEWGTFRPARGIVFAVVLGIVLWALVIAALLVEATR